MADRALMPDYLRLVALFGIVAVNVQFMGFPLESGFAAVKAPSALDTFTILSVNGFLTLKTYGLFSFMFGVGLGFQIASAKRHGHEFARHYRNRMLGLAGLGLLHGCLFFPGDILVIYAITGTAMYFMHAWPVDRLARTGIHLLVAQALIIAALSLIHSAPSPEFSLLESTAQTQGAFLDVALVRTIAFAVELPILLAIQGVAALGWFALGLAAVRSGLIDQPDHPFWARARRFLLPSLVLSLSAAAVAQWGDRNVGDVLIALTAPLATIGYLGLIAHLSRTPRPVMRRVLAAGGASLSIYLGQSIVLSTLFAGYGAGLWAVLSPLQAVALAFAVTAALILCLMIWRHFFRLGPFEWLLRRITYAGLPGETRYELRTRG